MVCSRLKSGLAGFRYFYGKLERISDMIEFFAKRKAIKEAHQAFKANKIRGPKAGKTYEDLPIVTKRLNKTTYQGSFFISSEELSNVDLSRYQIIMTIRHAPDMLHLQSFIVDQENEYAEIDVRYNRDSTRSLYDDFLVDITLLRIDEE